MHGGQHGAPLGLPGPEDLDQFFGRVQVQAGEGLVEQEDVGPLGKGPREEHALLLAAGKPADLPVGQAGQLEFGQGPVDPGPVRGAEAPPETQGRIAALFDDPADGDRKIPVDAWRWGR